MRQPFRKKQTRKARIYRLDGFRSPPGYGALLEDINERVCTAQVRITFAFNRKLIVLY
jgi:hypothetical protein